MIDTNRTIRIGNIYRDCENTGGNFGGNVFDIHGISPAIRTPSGGGVQPIIMVEVKQHGRSKD